MRRIFLTMVLAGSVTFSAVAVSAEDKASTAITGVIQHQIDAFLRDDFATAFTFASPNIKRLFGSAERFGSMVRSGYPMVWRPDDVRFMALRNIDGAWWQQVMVRDADGVLHMLDYQMIQTEEGWQINGVQLLSPPDVGA